jgi:type I restriction-modification system DNA methylase subunit
MHLMPAEQIAWSEWERRLQAMADIGRASKYQGFKDPLALLGIIYLQRQERIPGADATSDPLTAALRLGEDIENRRGLQGQPLSRSLLSGLSSVAASVLAGWLEIASGSGPSEGFAEWFAAKLDELGLAYQYDTPSSLSRLVASLFAGRSPSTIFDPACGTGGLLAAMAEQFGQATFLGQEINSEAYAWARLRFLVLGLRNVELALGNPLIDQAFDRLQPRNGFDLILTNPPFGRLADPSRTPLRPHRPKNLSVELSGRLSSEATYIKKIVGSLSSSGVAAVIVPNGFLSRGGADQKLREALVGNDAVQAIVGLPERLFAPGTAIETAILILDREKPDHQKGRVLFVDVRRLGRRHGNRVVLDDDTAERIKSSYSEWQDEEGFSQIVSFEGLDPKSFSFSPALYVKQPTRTTKMSPDDQRSRIVELEARYAMLCQEYEAVRSRLARSS